MDARIRGLSAALLVVVALLAVSGCTGDEDAEPDAAPTTTTTAGSDTGSAAPTGSASLEDEEFCAALAQLEQASQALALVDSTEREAVQEAWADAAAREEQVAALAPAEIAPAVATLVAASAEIRSLLEANGWDTQLLAGEEVGAILDDPELDAAQRQVNEYTADRCEA